MNLKFFILILFSFFIFSIVCSAQREKSDRQSEIPNRFKDLPKKELTNKIIISNNTGYSMNFSVSADNVNWKAKSLQTGYMLTYTTEGINIRIQTEARLVEYRLISGNSYSIAWNKDKKIWDIFRDP